MRALVLPSSLVGSTDGALYPSCGLSTSPAGAGGGGRATGCSLGPISLGPGRGLTGINPCCPKEKSVPRKAYLLSGFPHSCTSPGIDVHVDLAGE